ncbi:hypothetical protein GCM10025865_25890 [Paraoerskovia sediminicola]|uniref:HTH marR-type domain-containing protein n=1 Tax=Paraoerskovia sediminicola TaxID=1138587 RepID=A0ABM8G540_9CELL|nr:MarR family winged helix-turn-helix transcriptional regulator [Paraoerskovia sediminicola]BDZ43290.1 hypothetical protein GCM10025865_25890 [Paraoerskovia sediminicola]
MPDDASPQPSAVPVTSRNVGSSRPGTPGDHPRSARSTGPDAPHDQPTQFASRDYDSDDPEQWPTGRLLSSVARNLEREWNSHLSGWDLNHASMPVLLHLLGGARPQRALAAENGVTEQTMSRIVDRLERNGHVVRGTDPHDRRRRMVDITAEGRAAAFAAADPRRGEEVATRGLSADQIVTLRELLLAMVRAQQG